MCENWNVWEFQQDRSWVLLFQNVTKVSWSGLSRYYGCTLSSPYNIVTFQFLVYHNCRTVLQSLQVFYVSTSFH